MPAERSDNEHQKPHSLRQPADKMSDFVGAEDNEDQHGKCQQVPPRQNLVRLGQLLDQAVFRQIGIGEQGSQPHHQPCEESTTEATDQKSLQPA